MSNTTIYDIAKMAGVSPSTVSRVINNKSVKSANKQKVIKALKESSYIPNETARGLVTRSSRIIGILISDIRTTHLADGIYFIEQELTRHGYSCLIYNTGNDADSQVEHIRQLRQRKVDAAVLMGSYFEKPAIRQAIHSDLPDIPVLLCNAWLDEPNVYAVIADEQNGVKNAVEFLTGQKGRRCPALIMDGVRPSNDRKKAGFLEGVEKIPGLGEPTVMVVEGRSVQEGKDATLRLLQERPETDAIIYTEDVLASGGLHAISELGLRVPEQISVIGINNSTYAQAVTPPLTSLDNMIFDLGITIARNLTALLNGEHVSSKITIGTRLVVRDST